MPASGAILYQTRFFLKTDRLPRSRTFFETGFQEHIGISVIMLELVIRAI